MSKSDIKVSLFDKSNEEKDFVYELMTKSLIGEYGQPSDILNVENLLNHYYSRDDSVIYVARYKNKLSGFIWLIETSDVIVGNKFICVLYISIHKNFRGKGISRVLFDYSKDYCKKNNFSELRLAVRSDNDVALNLYNSLGFHIYKHEMKLEID